MRIIWREERAAGAERPNRRGTLAVVLAGLAVVLASTGTAVAVATTKVSIADANNPARVAGVDANNRLTVTGPTTTISASGLLGNYLGGDNYVTSPTKATLAITKIGLSESVYNAGAAGSALRVYVYKVGVDTSGSCTAAGYQQLALYQFGPGDQVLDQYAQPLLVKPTGTAAYCLDFYVVQLGSGSLTYFPGFQLSAYVVNGTYTGLGLPTTAGAAPAKVGTRGDAK